MFTSTREEVSPADFARFRDFIREKFGIDLPENKQALLTARLRNFIQEEGYGTFQGFVQSILNDPDPRKLGVILNQISTNHTFFFREPTHFECLREQMIPELQAAATSRRDSELRIWSAACSSGQETYSISMVLEEAARSLGRPMPHAILATDISSKVLDRARSGIYSRKELADVSAERRQAFFTERPDGAFEANANIRRDITFRRFNLLTPAYPFKKKFHIIFCRNVMIYFNPETTEHVINKMYESLVPGGYLVVGEAESVRDRNDRFAFLQAAVYQKI